MKEYSTIDIIRILGIPRERLRYWLDNHIVEPTRTEKYRRGTKSIFTIKDMYFIELLNRQHRHKVALSLGSLPGCLRLRLNKNWNRVIWINIMEIASYVDKKVEDWE